MAVVDFMGEEAAIVTDRGEVVEYELGAIDFHGTYPKNLQDRGPRVSRAA